MGVRGVTRVLPLIPARYAASSASANAIAEGKRSAGTFASARSMASWNASVTVGRTICNDGGRSPRWRAMSACAVRPVKGGSPASIS